MIKAKVGGICSNCEHAFKTGDLIGYSKKVIERARAAYVLSISARIKFYDIIDKCLHCHDKWGNSLKKSRFLDEPKKSRFSEESRKSRFLDEPKRNRFLEKKSKFI